MGFIGNSIDEPWCGEEAIKECMKSYPLERVDKELEELSGKTDDYSIGQINYLLDMKNNYKLLK